MSYRYERLADLCMILNIDVMSLRLGFVSPFHWRGLPIGAQADSVLAKL